MDEKLTAEELDEAVGDDLPETALAPGLVGALAEAGVVTKEEWDAMPSAKLKWPKSLGDPPDGIEVELVDV